MTTHLDPGKTGAALIDRGHVRVSDLMESVRECELESETYCGRTLVRSLVSRQVLDEATAEAFLEELQRSGEARISSVQAHDTEIGETHFRGDPAGLNERPTLIPDTGEEGSVSQEVMTTSRTRAQRIMHETRVMSSDDLASSTDTSETATIVTTAEVSDVLEVSETRFAKGSHAAPNEKAAKEEKSLPVGTAITLGDEHGDLLIVEAREELSPGDKYLIGQELGRGGMGVVRVAKDLDLGRPVAIKALHQKRQTDETMIRALIGEARLTGQLQHPNIIPVYELGIRPTGEVFYTMKMVGTTRLYDVFRRLKSGDEETQEEFSLLRLLNIFQRICMALHYAHSRGVIHRDVKPDNVLLGNFGEVQLMDWGIAKVLGGTASAFTGEGVVAGTPEYMSPEQAAGEDRKVDHRSDIYSLGVILYEILTRTLPLDFPDRRGNLKAFKAQSFSPPHIRAPSRRIPVELSTICMKALSLEPEDRYEDAGEMWREIEQVLEGSKEREQLRKWVETEVEQGLKTFEEYAALLEEQADLGERLYALERDQRPWASDEERRESWECKNRLSALDVVLGRTFAEAYKFYQRALGYDPTDARARDGLSRLYDSRIEIARRDRDVSHLVYFSGLRRELVGKENESPGGLTVRSYPEGAEVYLFDSDDLAGEMRFGNENSIGRTPIYEVEVKSGGYLLVARMDGFRDTHETVFVQSGHTDAHMLILDDWTTDMPFVERTEELGRIRQQHQIVLGHGRFRSVVVCGASGSGKDRILRAFDNYIIPIPMVHLYIYVAGLKASRLVPYGAFAELLRHRLGVVPGDPPARVRERLEDFVTFALVGKESRHTLSDEEGAEVQRLSTALAEMPGLGVIDGIERSGDVDGALRYTAIQEAIVQLFEHLAERMPLVIILRDVNWFDYASWDLVQSLRMRLQESRIFLLTSTDLTTQDGDPHTLHGYDEVIHLNPLSTSAVAHLMREVLQAPVSPELVSAIYRHTEGYAYAVEWSVRRLVWGGHLEQADGFYVLSEEGQEMLRERFDLQMVVGERLSRLDSRAREILEMAALLGRTFWIDSLHALGYQDAHDATSELVRSEFVTRQTQGSFAHGDEYRFRFELEWRAISESISLKDARRLHERAIKWLSTFADDDLQWCSRRADHFHAIGRYDDAAKDCHVLGKAAADCGSFKDAARCMGRAFEVAEDPRLKASALFHRMWVLIRAGEVSTARRDLPDMLALQGHLSKAESTELAEWQVRGVL